MLRKLVLSLAILTAWSPAYALSNSGANVMCQPFITSGFTKNLPPACGSYFAGVIETAWVLCEAHKLDPVYVDRRFASSATADMTGEVIKSYFQYVADNDVVLNDTPAATYFVWLAQAYPCK